MRKPRYDLTAAQEASIQISDACVAKANQVLNTDPKKARRYIDALFKSVRAGDFAHVETMPQRVGKPMFGDVYGKFTDDVLWFIKFKFDGTTTTVVMSCHEAERAIELANGRTLKKKAVDPSI